MQMTGKDHFCLILEPGWRHLFRARGKDSFRGGIGGGCCQTLKRVTVMTLGEDGTVESGNVN